VGDVAATTWVTYRQALRLFVRGVTMRSAARITLVVGTWLSVMNQGGQILDGVTAYGTARPKSAV
jgi:hypothetical protein